MQPADYDRFKPFFSKVIADYHGVDVDAKHTNDWNLSGVEGLPEDGNLDLAALGLPELSMRVRVGRNLSDFPLPGAMNQDDRVNLENKVGVVMLYFTLIFIFNVLLLLHSYSFYFLLIFYVCRCAKRLRSWLRCPSMEDGTTR